LTTQFVNDWTEFHYNGMTLGHCDECHEYAHVMQISDGFRVFEFCLKHMLELPKFEGRDEALWNFAVSMFRGQYFSIQKFVNWKEDLTGVKHGREEFYSFEIELDPMVFFKIYWGAFSTMSYSSWIKAIECYGRYGFSIFKTVHYPQNPMKKAELRNINGYWFLEGKEDVGQR
jgi:hypothetical protein